MLTVKYTTNGTELTTAIATLVTTLGDFPLDPQAGLGWIWSADGRRLLWASPKALETFGFAATEHAPAFDHQETLRSMVADLALPAPDQEPVRVLQLSLVSPTHREMFMCLARAVALSNGSYGILVVAVGAPARRLEDINATSLQSAVAPEKEPQPPTDVAAAESTTTLAETVRQPTPEPATVPQPAARQKPADTAPQTVQAPLRDSGVASDVPSWVGQPSETLRPLRFVWQTDVTGRVVHLSRELSDAVGTPNAMRLGQTWQEIADKTALSETDDIIRGFASRDTWTAKPVLWPVAGTSLGIPVEMAGMPVREGGQFAGFRGYGIARIERAIERPGSASEALAQDDKPATENDDDRFGPSVSRMLSTQPSVSPPLADANQPDLRAVQAGNITPRRPLPLSELPGTGTDALPPVHALQQFIDASHRNRSATTPSTGGTMPVQPTVGPHDARGNDPASKNLTDQERRAFRDIARALGGVGGESEPGAIGPASISPPLPVANQPGGLRQPTAEVTQTTNLSTGTRPSAGIMNGEQAGASPSVLPFGPSQKQQNDSARNHLRLLAPASTDLPSLFEKLPVGLMVMRGGEVVFANRQLLDMLDHDDVASLAAACTDGRLFGSHGVQDPQDIRSFQVIDSKGQSLAVKASIQAISWDGLPATLTSFLPTMKPPADTDRDALELDMLAARAALRELQSVLDTATDGIISLNGEGRILGLNRSAEALFGFDQNEIAGESITTLLAPESHLAAMDYLEGLKVNGVASIMNDGRDIIGRERNGGAIPLFMTLGRLGEDSRAQRFCAVLRDVTAWKKAEADLQEARRLAEDSNANKTAFLTRISHEVRTPLNAILGFSQVMMTESLGPIGNARYAQYAKDIHVSGQHVLSLVNDLLDLSKVNSGKLELAFGSVDVLSVVGESVAMIQPQATAGKIIVRSQLSSRLPPVVADDRSLRQILLNLLSNAIKFTEPGGQVVVSATFNDQGEVVIRVRDTGIGMSDDELKSAMEPFRQVAGPRASGGTGLGLPLTKALVEANRASFNLVSERHKGTLAEVVFPSTRVLAE